MLLLLLLVSTLSASTITSVHCGALTAPMACSTDTSNAFVNLTGPMTASLQAGAANDWASASLTVADTLRFTGPTSVRLFFSYSRPVIYAPGSSAGFTLAVNDTPVLAVDSARLSTLATLTLTGQALANSGPHDTAWGIQTQFALVSLYGLDTADTYGHDIPQNHILSGFTYASESGLDYPVFGATRVAWEAKAVTHNPEPSAWFLVVTGLILVAVRRVRRAHGRWSR